MKRIATLIVVLLLISIGTFLYVTQREKNIDKQTAESPTTTEEKNLELYTFDEINLTFSAPFELDVTGEKVDDTFIMTAQRSAYPQPDYYQLYGVYRFTDPKEINKEDLKSNMNATSIEETTTDGFYTIKGQYEGERSRFVTVIVTDKGLFTLATSQPTEENKKLTDSLLATFDFK